MTEVYKSTTVKRDMDLDSFTGENDGTNPNF